MSSSVAQDDTSLGSRRRLLSARSRSARRPAKDPSNARVATFRALVLAYWKKKGRHNLPWRQTDHPYKILVSEVMLQQTQVDRVILFYENFLRRFPTVQALANASLVDVLKVWSGLGYNRRAKYLRDAAIQIVEKHNGKVPREYESLLALSGVGDYTARAVRVFALNKPDVLIETNIRTIYVYYISGFRKSRHRKLRDIELVPFARAAAEGQDPREWHSALMDYGAHLKQCGLKLNSKSAHYAKQSKFEGSLRQIRGAILKSLASRDSTIDLRGRYGGRYRKALDSLVRDGLITRSQLRESR